MLMASKRLNTFNHWAQEISKQINQSVSKQALWEKLTTSSVPFCEELLKESLRENYQKVDSCNSVLFKNFDSVLVQDSTTIQLPAKLASVYCGSSNQSGAPIAVARIDTIFDLKSDAFVRFELRQFTDNDQSASSRVLPFAKKRALIIRDRGYFSLPVLREIIQSKGAFLTRAKHGVKYYDPTTNKQINLPKILKKKGSIDQIVLAGATQKLKLRLVATALPQKAAAKNRRTSKNNRDKRSNHSKEYYFLQGYAIFLTNVDNKTWSIKQVTQAYRLRWRIESIFKCWKSCFNIDKLIHHQCTSPIRVKAFIFLMLTYLAVYHAKFYLVFKEHIQKKYNKNTSLNKVATFFNINLQSIIQSNNKTQQWEDLILRHCLYETRKDRLNFQQIYSLA